MKTNIQRILLLAVFSLFMSCSSDDEIPGPGSVYSDPPDSPGTYVPVEPIPDSTALEMVGFPKVMKKYQDGKLYEWAQYFYRPDGQLLKINYNYPENGPELITYTYQYDADGKLIGYGDYYKFYWDEGHIIKAELNNAAWYGRIRIFYDYNSEGQIIQSTENYIDASFSLKNTYSYFNGGDLKTIEFYSQEYEKDFELYSITNFEGYLENENLFLEFVIIPGQVAQQQFPISMKVVNITDSSYDSYEIYDYQYDSEGRVIEKTFGSNKVVYEYY